MGYTSGMDDELRARLDRIETKVDAAQAAAEHSRKYLFWISVISVALVVLPAIGMMFALPSFLGSYSGADMEMLLQ